MIYYIVLICVFAWCHWRSIAVDAPWVKGASPSAWGPERPMMQSNMR